MVRGMGPRSRAALDPAEVLGLEALRRTALGVAHALGNALTAVLGETSLLRLERKRDRIVAEACAAIESEVQRSAEALGTLRGRLQPLDRCTEAETDLVTWATKLAASLRPCLSRRFTLTIEHPDDLVLVRGAPQTLELVASVLAHRVLEACEASGELVLRIREEGELASVEIELRAEGLAPEAADRALEGPPGSAGFEPASTAFHRSA